MRILAQIVGKGIKYSLNTPKIFGKNAIFCTKTTESAQQNDPNTHFSYIDITKVVIISYLCIHRFMPLEKRHQHINII